MKKVLTVQDISCVGKVSLTVALPILSAMGMSTSVIPYGGFIDAYGLFRLHFLRSKLSNTCDHDALERPRSGI